MMTNEQQRIAHLEKLADDAGKTLAFLQSRVDTLTEERDQLIQKNTALVAENAVIFSLMKQQAECFNAAITEGFHESIMQCGIEHLIDVYQRRLQPAIQCIPPTVNTDAAIAAIRAEGVEMLRDSIRELERGTEDTLDLYHYCSDFAHQLRESKGANHE